MRRTMKILALPGLVALVCGLAICLLFTGVAVAQSTATLQGTVTDATGASVPNATITVRNQSTNEERTTRRTTREFYIVPSHEPRQLRTAGVECTGQPDSTGCSGCAEPGIHRHVRAAGSDAVPGRRLGIVAAAPAFDQADVLKP